MFMIFVTLNNITSVKINSKIIVIYRKNNK